MYIPQCCCGSNWSSVVHLRIAIGNGTSSQGQSCSNILLVSGVDGVKGGGGVTEVNSHCHEHAMKTRVRDEAIVGSLGPADDGESRRER